MKVKILVEFEVEPVDDEGWDDDDQHNEQVAKSAASLAAYDYLSLVEVSGYSTDTDKVTVHVDGFGECLVSLGENHE